MDIPVNVNLDGWGPIVNTRFEHVTKHNHATMEECHFNGDTLQCICPKELTYNQPFYKGDTCAIIQQNCDYDQNEYEKNVEIHGKPCSGHGTLYIR